MWEQYDREELYRKVWEKPMLKVAEEYGVSSVALGKTCQKLSVPVPGRGHWAKLAHGHEGVKKPPLPKLDKVPVIYRAPVVQRKAISSDQGDPEFAAINHLLSSGALSPQPTDPNARLHPLIRSTASLLRSQSRKDENGILLPREPGGLNVRVSAGALDRALKLMAQIISVLEKQSFSVEVTEQGPTVALLNGERVSFGIEESIRRVVTQKPRVERPTDRWDYDEIVTHEPSGRLSLMIHSGSFDRNAERTRWSDAKVQKLEGRIAEFVAGLMRTAVALRRKEEQSKREEAERQRRAQELARLSKDVQEEEKKLEQFNKWVDEWNRAELLRRFIAVYAEKSQSWNSDKQAQYKAWIEWATQQADRVDPFVAERPPSVLDRKRECVAL